MKMLAGRYSALVLGWRPRAFLGKSWFRKISLALVGGGMLIVWVSSALGQRQGNSGANPGTIARPDGMYTSQAGMEHLNLEVNLERQKAAKSEWSKTGREGACFFPPLNTVRSTGVGVADLG